MARIFLAPVAGDGNPDRLFIPGTTTRSSFHPDCDLSGTTTGMQRFEFNGVPFFFCVSVNLNGAPDNTLDLGNPFDVNSLDVVPNTNARRQVERYFAMPSGTLNGRTRRQILKYCLNNLPKLRVRLASIRDGIVNLDLIREGID